MNEDKIDLEAIRALATSTAFPWYVEAESLGFPQILETLVDMAEHQHSKYSCTECADMWEYGYDRGGEDEYERQRN